MHRVRIPSFVLLTISDLHSSYMYIPSLLDVHVGATAPIPVATGLVLGCAKPLGVSAARLCVVKYL